MKCKENRECVQAIFFDKRGNFDISVFEITRVISIYIAGRPDALISSVAPRVPVYKFLLIPYIQFIEALFY